MSAMFVKGVKVKLSHFTVEDEMHNLSGLVGTVLKSWKHQTKVRIAGSGDYVIANDHLTQVLDMSPGAINQLTKRQITDFIPPNPTPSRPGIELTPKHDMVNSPPHYNQGKVECIDAIEAAVSGLNGIEAHCTGTAIKYLWRWKHKGGKEDLKKAIWYIERLVKDCNAGHLNKMLNDYEKTKA